MKETLDAKLKCCTQWGATILGVRTLNIQKTNIIEKGIGTLLLGKTVYVSHKKDILEVSILI